MTDTTYLKQLIDELTTGVEADKLTTWEADFLDEMEARSTYSKKQADKIMEIHERVSR